MIQKLQRGKNIYMCYEKKYLHEFRYSYMPEPWKWFPFRAEPPRIGRFRDYTPPPPTPAPLTQFKVAEHSFAGGQQ